MTDETPTDAGSTPDAKRVIGRPFQPGNQAAKGNRSPLAKKQAEFRTALHAAITADDLAEIAHAMIAEAVDGDTQAARLVLEYTVGKPAAAPTDDEDGDDDRPLLGRMEVRFVPALAAPVAVAPERGVA